MRSIKLFAVLGLLAATPASAWAHSDRHQERRAPARAAYVAPARRPVWVPGYWARRGPRPVWHVGAWVTPPQAGWSWVAPYRTRDRGRWVWSEGYWAPSHAYARGY
jgi:hypothetical protein